MEKLEHFASLFTENKTNINPPYKIQKEKAL
jgi:hypothetical protein